MGKLGVGPDPIRGARSDSYAPKPLVHLKSGYFLIFHFMVLLGGLMFFLVVGISFFFCFEFFLFFCMSSFSQIFACFLSVKFTDESL